MSNNEPIEGFECDCGSGCAVMLARKFFPESCDAVKCAVSIQMRTAKRRERLSLGAGAEQQVREEKCERILSKYSGLHIV